MKPDLKEISVGIENQIVLNFEKGLISEEIFLQGINTLDRMEKGTRATIGEVRTWKGVKYQKNINGWNPVKGGSKSQKSEFEGMTNAEISSIAHTPGDPLSEHAKLEINRQNKEKGGTPRFEDTQIDRNKLDQETSHAEAVRNASQLKFEAGQRDFEVKLSELNLLGEGWAQGWSKTARSKSYGDDSFVKVMQVQVSSDFVSSPSNYFSVSCGYSNSPSFGEEADMYYNDLNKIQNSKFSSIKEAEKAADRFAKAWNDYKTPNAVGAISDKFEIGSTVRLRPEIGNISLYNLKDKDLKIVGVEVVNFASGSQNYYHVEFEGGQSQVAGRFLENNSN